MSPQSPEIDPAALRGREVWLFAAVPWDFALLGSSRSLAMGLRELGAKVTFVEPPSLKKSLRRLRHGHGAPEDVQVIGMPPSVPKISDRLPLVPRVHDALQRSWLRARLSGRRPIAIVSTPRWAPVLEGLAFSSIWYHCLDDLRVHAAPAVLAQFERWEKQLLARSRGSFAVSPALARSLEALGAGNVSVQGNAVHFEQLRGNADPPDPKGGARRIGYLGAIFEWVDLSLLEAIARAMPEHELYLVGPVRRGVDVGPLKRLPNVRFLGFRPYDGVPKAISSFDVALIPFHEGVVARAADPIKIYEYFSFGLPVVTTPVGDVESISSLLYLASGPEAYVSAVRAALAEQSPELREKRVAYARANDWTERSKAIARLLVRDG